MVVVKKKNGNLRICLDPKDLNLCIALENYPLSTIEAIAAKLNKAKLFTVLDVKNGFWQIKLEKESSMLTTFNTHFGRYIWLRIPFGLCSAPEIFQRNMHELIEEISGIEVIADDFLVVGCGDTIEEATIYHDKKLGSFLRKCTKEKIHLNIEKLKLREKKVTYIGHTLSA